MNTPRYDDLGANALGKLAQILRHSVGNPLSRIDPGTLSDASVSHALAAEIGKLQILREVEAALARATPK